MKRIKEKLEESRNLLWWISLISGVITLFALTLRAIYPHIEPQWGLVVVYSAPLIALVIIKESVRWSDWNNGEWGSRIGHIFVPMWWAVFMFILVTNFILEVVNTTSWRLIIPEELFVTFIEVLILYAGSEISKHKFSAKNNKNKK